MPCSLARWWRWVAERYSSWEWIAGYEIMSEPRTKITPQNEVFNINCFSAVGSNRWPPSSRDFVLLYMRLTPQPRVLWDLLPFIRCHCSTLLIYHQSSSKYRWSPLADNYLRLAIALYFHQQVYKENAQMKSQKETIKLPGLAAWWGISS